MIVAFSVSPSGRPEGAGTHQSSEDGSVHEAVAAAVQVVRDSGLPNHTSSMFTRIIESKHDWHSAHQG